MNTKFLLYGFVVLFVLAVSCEKEQLQRETQIDDNIIALVEDEVLADINFAELLDEGDDGLFWGDADFSMLKSGDKHKNPCASRLVERTDNSRIVTLDFSAGEKDCGKSGVITIEYHKPKEKNEKGKKTITYIDFSRKEGIIYNGVKKIERGNENQSVKSEITIEKTKDGETKMFFRNSNRQVEWLCGPGKDTNHIKKISGQTEVTTTVEGEERTYTRKIITPLLLVKACDLKVQAGTVKVERNGEEIIIDYGEMPNEMDCDAEYECDSSIEVTKNGETVTVVIEDGKRVKQNKDKD